MNVNELKGFALDNAVLAALGVKIPPACIALSRDLWSLSVKLDIGEHDYDEPFCPSTIWRHGGPLIERERISVYFAASGEAPHDWYAYISEGAMTKIGGPTPLIAAMRAFVASKQP